MLKYLIELFGVNYQDIFIIKNLDDSQMKAYYKFENDKKEGFVLYRSINNTYWVKLSETVTAGVILDILKGRIKIVKIDT